MEKMHAIDRGRDGGLAGMPYGSHGAREIHEVHYLSAEDVAEPVGIVRERQFGVFGNGLADGFAFHHAAPSLYFLVPQIAGRIGFGLPVERGAARREGFGESLL